MKGGRKMDKYEDVEMYNPDDEVCKECMEDEFGDPCDDCDYCCMYNEYNNMTDDEKEFGLWTALHEEYEPDIKQLRLDKLENIVKLNCNHQFCCSCIVSVLETNNVDKVPICALCRADITTIEVNSGDNYNVISGFCNM